MYFNLKSSVLHYHDRFHTLSVNLYARVKLVSNRGVAPVSLFRIDLNKRKSIIWLLCVYCRSNVNVSSSLLRIVACNAVTLLQRYMHIYFYISLESGTLSTQPMKKGKIAGLIACETLHKKKARKHSDNIGYVDIQFRLLQNVNKEKQLTATLSAWLHLCLKKIHKPNLSHRTINRNIVHLSLLNLPSLLKYKKNIFEQFTFERKSS